MIQDTLTDLRISRYCLLASNEAGNIRLGHGLYRGNLRGQHIPFGPAQFWNQRQITRFPDLLATDRPPRLPPLLFHLNKVSIDDAYRIVVLLRAYTSLELLVLRQLLFNRVNVGLRTTP